MNDACGIINICDRRKIELTGIKAVDSFDEYSVVLSVSCGKLTIEGEAMGITVLDLDKGIVCAEGRINAVIYSEQREGERGGLFARLFGGKR